MYILCIYFVIYIYHVVYNMLKTQIYNIHIIIIIHICIYIYTRNIVIDHPIKETIE